MPNSPEEHSTPPPGSPEEALRRLEQRLDRASEAAERLMGQAAAEAARAVGSFGGSGEPGKAGNPSDPGAAAESTGGSGDPGGAGNPGGAGDPGGAGGRRGARDPGGAGTRAGPGSPGDPAKPPPTGWQIPEGGGASPDLDPFVGLIQAVRDLIPPELQRRLIAALRELLLALRALIDWYLERLELRHDRSVQVEDIPII